MSLSGTWAHMMMYWVGRRQRNELRKCIKDLFFSVWEWPVISALKLRQEFPQPHILWMSLAWHLLFAFHLTIGEVWQPSGWLNWLVIIDQKVVYYASTFYSLLPYPYWVLGSILGISPLSSSQIKLELELFKKIQARGQLDLQQSQETVTWFKWIKWVLSASWDAMLWNFTYIISI